MRKLLVSITSTRGVKSGDWSFIEDEILSVKELGLREIAFFPTCLNAETRKTVYQLLEQVPHLSIPFIHARADMSIDEFHYCQSRFHTEFFNLHCSKYFHIPAELTALKNVIAIENSGHAMYLQDVRGYAGLCLDLTHLESDRLLRPENYERVKEIIEAVGVRANHISAIRDKVFYAPHDPAGAEHYDCHYLTDMSQLDYVATYPEHYFGNYVAIELENPLSEQIKMKAYLETTCPFLKA
ncbi:MAG: hypothetical protein IT292_10550 [Deltaproteobacteria bacterium]|nr:hypothetical protein [Deltaproteobacteria bacterium]